MKQLASSKDFLLSPKLALFVSHASFLLSCGSVSSVDIVAGKYELVSASLNASGTRRVLECLGNFSLTVSEISNDQAVLTTIRIKAQGATACRSANPASLTETLGGDCQLKELALVRKSKTFVYESLPEMAPVQSLKCFAERSGAEGNEVHDSSVVLIQAYNSDALMLTHSSSLSPAFTSFVLKRLPE